MVDSYKNQEVGRVMCPMEIAFTNLNRLIKIKPRYR